MERPIEISGAEKNRILTATSTKPDGKDIELSEVSVAGSHFSLHAGAFLLNPYRVENITNGVGTLSQNDAEAAWFFELAVNWVSAWEPGRRERLYLDTKRINPNNVGNGRVIFKPGKLSYRNPDVQARFAAFLHNNDDDKTASTIVGSGEFSGEVTLGLPLFGAMFLEGEDIDSGETFYNQTTSAHFVDLIYSYGATTDRGNFDVHHRNLAGLAYRAAYKVPTNKKIRRELLMDVRAGAAWIESTPFEDERNRLVKVDYETELGWALETELYYPLGDTANIVMGSRIYGGHDPNPWNAYIALSLSVEELKKTLFGD